ncbi:hypothetical protein BDZ90DRAFT_183873 [Jaminaea rosea]|uniref:PH domain-containing protein n=1 Tax=Jaminaea rosea TaxID=1569628 RepID=A0A316UP12_9BASI|nr:hypothetical protein BDZ90DRAFT_183873 [Jaminaea rosea]PWN27027.1 hypothetical protein BDZ90DRAFT_183873 [Jaminaea rosea]
MSVAAAASTSAHRLPTYEGSLLVNLSGRWEEKWCALLDGSLHVYHSRVAAATDPTLVAATYQLSSFDSLQTSGSWGASEGPFELILSLKKRPSLSSRRSSGTSSMLPRAATSGSLHALFERSANIAPRKSPQPSGDAAPATAPRFNLRVDAEEEPDVPAEAASPPQTSSRLSSWLRLPGRPRVSSFNRLSPKSGGSDRALGDRFRREAVTSPKEDHSASVVVVRAPSASAMTRWAEMISPWLQRAEPPSNEPSNRAQSSLTASPSSRPPKGEQCALATSSGSSWGGAMTRVRSRLSITDLLEDAGNNARRRRVESSAGSGDASQTAQESVVVPPSAPRRRLRRLSIETGKRLSLISGSSNTSSNAMAGSSRPNTSSGMSVKSTFGSMRRSVSSIGDHRTSVQSDRRASSPMALFALFKSGGTPDEPHSRSTTAAPQSAPQRFVSTFQPNRAMSPTPEPAQDGSLDEIMGNERRHAMQRFAELRKAGSPTMEAPDPLAAAAPLPFPESSAHSGMGGASWMSSPPLPSSSAMRSKVSSNASSSTSNNRAARDVGSDDSMTATEPPTPRTPIGIEEATSRFAAFSFKSSIRPSIPAGAQSVHRKPASRVGVREVFPATGSATVAPHEPVRSFSATETEANGSASGLPSSTSMPTGLGRIIGKGANKMMRLGTAGRDLSGGKSPGRICEVIAPSSPTTEGSNTVFGSPLPEDTPSPLIIERILPPEVMVSRMDAIGRLGPYEAAEAKRDLRSEAAATSPALTPSMSATAELGGNVRTRKKSASSTLGLGIFADEEQQVRADEGRHETTHHLPTSRSHQQLQSTSTRPRIPFEDLTRPNAVPAASVAKMSKAPVSHSIGLPVPPRQMGKKRSAPLLSCAAEADSAAMTPIAGSTPAKNRESAFTSPPRKMATPPRRMRSAALAADKENNDDASAMPPPSTLPWQTKDAAAASRRFSLASHASLYQFGAGSNSGTNSRRSSVLSTHSSSTSASRRGGHSRHHSLMATRQQPRAMDMTHSSFGPLDHGASKEELRDDADDDGEDGLERAGNEWRQWLRRQQQQQQQQRRPDSVATTTDAGWATGSNSTTTSARSSTYDDLEGSSVEAAQIYAVTARLRPVHMRTLRTTSPTS